MIRPSDIEFGHWPDVWLKDYVPEGREKDAGWRAVNSIATCDCIPRYQLPGGGVSAHNLTDLPEAIDKSISNIEQRIRLGNEMIQKLREFKETL